MLNTSLARSERDLTLSSRELCVSQEQAQAGPTLVRVPRLQDDDDATLVTRVGQQDRAAFAELVRRHIGLCMGLARRVLGNDADAEDVAQETMLKLWQTGAELTIGAPGLRPWLARVVYNRAIDRVRARKPTDTLDVAGDISEAPSQINSAEARDVKERVEQALDRLPERQRVALVLFHYQGFTQTEVADAMTISVDAVESLLGRARRALRTDLADDWKSLLSDAPL